MPAILGSGEHRYRVVENWAKLPDGWRLTDVASVAVDSKDRVYVFNRGNYPLLVFDPDGNLLDYSQVNDYGRPHSITIDSGAMFLVDDGAHFIEKRTLDGELLFELHGVVGDHASSSRRQDQVSGCPRYRGISTAARRAAARR